jgi:WD40 repeat protein
MDIPRRKLREIIQRYGRGVCDDPRRVRNLLRDLCGTHKREINLLMHALHEEVAADLQKIPPNFPTALPLSQLSRRLQDRHAMQASAARWAVEAWAWALGVIADPSAALRLRGHFVHPVLIAQGLEHRLGRGSIRQILLLEGDEVVVLAEGGAMLLNVASGEVLWDIDCPVVCGALGPGGRFLALARASCASLSSQVSAKIAIDLWDLSKAGVLHTLESVPVQTLAFSPDGTLLVAGGMDGMLNVWGVAEGECFYTLKGHMDAVNALDFSPNGQLLASAAGGLLKEDTTIRLWDVRSGALLRVLEGHTDAVNSLAFSPDGGLLASASGGLLRRDPTIRLWDVESGTLLFILVGHTESVNRVTFSPDGQTLVSSSHESVRLWDVTQGVCRQTLDGHAKGVTDVIFSVDGDHLASGDGDNICLWSSKRGDLLETFQGQSGPVTSVAFSPDGQRLAIGSLDAIVRVWTVAEGALLSVLDGHQGPVARVAFSPDGLLLASWGEDDTVRIWSLAQCELLRTFKWRTGRVRSMMLGSDGHMLAASDEGTCVRLWSVNGALGRKTSTPAVLSTIEGDRVWSMAFSPDGRVLASGGAEDLCLWSVQRGALLHVLKGHTGPVSRVRFSADGHFLASSSLDETVRLWSVARGEALCVLKGHTGWVRDVTFSPDGRLLASGTRDRAVDLWSVEQGSILRTLLGHAASVDAVAFSPDGQRLASASFDGTVRLWWVDV